MTGRTPIPADMAGLVHPVARSRMVGLRVAMLWLADGRNVLRSVHQPAVRTGQREESLMSTSNGGHSTRSKGENTAINIATGIVFIGLALVVLAVCAAVAWRLFDWIAP